jgi:hypothetical protein
VPPADYDPIDAWSSVQWNCVGIWRVLLVAGTRNRRPTGVWATQRSPARAFARNVAFTNSLVLEPIARAMQGAPPRSGPAPCRMHPLASARDMSIDSPQMQGFKVCRRDGRERYSRTDCELQLSTNTHIILQTQSGALARCTLQFRCASRPRHALCVLEVR